MTEPDIDALHASLNTAPEVVIDWFDDFRGPNPFAFLSNFYASPLVYEGRTFDTAEHAFHYAKVDTRHRDGRAWRHDIEYADGPGHAKSLGQRCPMRPDWEEVKYAVMRWVVADKFGRGTELAERLLATGSAYLQEGTYWDDRCWGVDLYSSRDWWRRAGTNWLGVILMERRAWLLAVGDGLL